MELQVQHRPVPAHPFDRVAYDEGDQGAVHCEMRAFPEPRFDWTLNDDVLGKLISIYIYSNSIYLTIYLSIYLVYICPKSNCNPLPHVPYSVVLTRYLLLFTFAPNDSTNCASKIIPVMSLVYSKPHKSRFSHLN